MALLCSTFDRRENIAVKDASVEFIEAHGLLAFQGRPARTNQGSHVYGAGERESEIFFCGFANVE